jgi:sulfur carrier protein ThiS
MVEMVTSLPLTPHSDVILKEGSVVVLMNAVGGG